MMPPRELSWREARCEDNDDGRRHRSPPSSLGAKAAQTQTALAARMLKMNAESDNAVADLLQAADAGINGVVKAATAGAGDPRHHGLDDSGSRPRHFSAALTVAELHQACGSAR